MTKTTRLWKAVAGVVVAAALIVAPVAPAMAGDGVKGEIGELQPWSSDTNKTSYWENKYKQYDAACYKHEGERNSHGTITDGGKTVTLSAFQSSWPGDGWVALIVKGGSESNNVILKPIAGVAYASPLNNGGKQSDVSHWIVCKGAFPEGPEPTQELDCTSITVDYGRALKNGDHINIELASGKQVNAYVDRNLGGWNDLGIRFSDGTKVKLTKEQVESGKITWKYSELIKADTYTVSFVQTNETDTWPELECGVVKVTPSAGWTLPDCFKDGVLTLAQTVNWTSVKNDDGSTTWKASPKPGTTFPAGVKTEWTVPDLAKLLADHPDCKPGQPEPKVEISVKETAVCDSKTVTVVTTTTTTPSVWNGKAWVDGTPVVSTVTSSRPMTVDEKKACPLPEPVEESTPWEDGEWACGDTVVERTREITTVTYSYNDAGEVVAASSKRTETGERDLTAQERFECPLLPGDIASTCVGDVPYLGYEVTLPEGFTPEGENPVTITFVNPEGEDYVVTDQPLAGSMLWPGASATEPKMWPGWDLVDGEYVETDGNFAWTREGVTVRFDVNPSYETVVEYPEATDACANPPAPPAAGETPSATATPAAAALPATGGTVPLPFLITGGALLVAGLGLVAMQMVRARRARSES